MLKISQITKFEKFLCLKIFVCKILALKFICALQEFYSRSHTYYVCWKYFTCLIFALLGECENFLQWKFPKLQHVCFLLVIKTTCVQPGLASYSLNCSHIWYTNLWPVKCLHAHCSATYIDIDIHFSGFIKPTFATTLQYANCLDGI